MRVIVVTLNILSYLTLIQAFTYRTAAPNERFVLRNIFVVKNIYDCSKRNGDGHSMRETIFSVRNCLRIYILHCLKKTQNVNEAYVNETAIRVDNQQYCGMLNMNSIRTIHNPYYFHFTVLASYIMHFNILYFNFEWSHLGCQSHSLVVSASVFGDVFLCGRRQTSIFIINDYHASMETILTPDRFYEFVIFYSIVRPAWLDSTIRVAKLSAPVLFLPQSIFYPAYDRFFQFIVTVHPLKYIVFVKDTKTQMVQTTFYDGPGLLSTRLNVVDGNTFITSSFNGVIYLRYTGPSRFDIQISISSHKLRRFRTACYIRKRTYDLPISMNAYTNKNKGIMCYKKFSRFDGFLRFHISHFIHVGPTVIDGDNDCQYGGLFIYRVGPTIRICSRRTSYLIYGENRNMTILLVWFPGYSHGQVLGSIQEETCTTTYIPWDNNILRKNNIIPRDDAYCQRLICPAHYSKKTGYCELQINGLRQYIGASIIGVGEFHGLHPCLNHLISNMTYYNISALHSEKWPMTAMKISKMTIAPSMEIKFDFLRNVNISLPNICHIEMPFRRRAVILKKSVCFIQPVYQTVKWKFLLNSLEITPACLGPAFVLARDKVSDVFYIVDDGRQTGLDVGVHTMNCPKGCNNYSVVLTVIKESKTSVYQYIGNANDILFTGFYHRGFRVTVIPANYSCSQHYQCKVGISIRKPQYPIGVTNTTVVYHGNQEWHMFPKR